MNKCGQPSQGPEVIAARAIPEQMISLREGLKRLDAATNECANRMNPVLGIVEPTPLMEDKTPPPRPQPPLVEELRDAVRLLLHLTERIEDMTQRIEL